MYDQILMGVLNSGAYVAKKLQFSSERETVFLAIICDWFSLNQFHHEIGQTVPCRSAIEQAGDVRMIEAGQNLPLA